MKEEQRDLLAALGVEEDPELVAARSAAAARPKRSQADRFQQGLEALAAFARCEGHARVPRARKETLGAVERPGGTGELEAGMVVALGTWLNDQKARRAKLTPGQLAQLAEHGMEWA
ncbi:helicase associated domain-containing protein [Kitasatospora herbaricolor]|uniref:helicase associated domain-containing protein n=1 Tax=Kitasatospora herbaricolor TaxID=68217 RepID=UPI0036DC24AB